MVENQIAKKMLKQAWNWGDETSARLKEPKVNMLYMLLSCIVMYHVANFCIALYQNDLRYKSHYQINQIFP